MEKERLNWQNLRRNKCPRCNGDLARHIETSTVRCSGACPFRITEQRALEIVTDMNKESLARSDYQNSETVEDLQKSACTFCHEMHSPQEKCAGFGE